MVDDGRAHRAAPELAALHRPHKTRSAVRMRRRRRADPRSFEGIVGVEKPGGVAEFPIGQHQGDRGETGHARRPRRRRTMCARQPRGAFTRCFCRHSARRRSRPSRPREMLADGNEIPRAVGRAARLVRIRGVIPHSSVAARRTDSRRSRAVRDVAHASGYRSIRRSCRTAK